MDLRSFRLSLQYTILVFGLGLVYSTVAQQEKPQQPVQTKTTKPSVVFPDEYSDLDDNSTKRAENDAINQRLEDARQFYLRGLAAIEHRDTIKAARYFEIAIGELNKLASTPGIEQNEDYTDLAQSIIEDYESYIPSFENLGENSPLFILREKIFQEVERSQNKTSILPLVKPTEQPTKGPSLMTTIPLTQNEFVTRHIEFLTSEKGRKYFTRWIERTTRWFPMLRQIAREENMPEEIIHLAMIESALNPKAVSRASAVGMWQFIQSTGELYNLRVSQWTDNRCDPEKATRAAMRHLRDLYNELGNWHLALAAYNCGINGVKRAIKACGQENPDFWAIRGFLPRETREYVPMYIAATLITMQHEAYGFKKSELNFEPEFKCDTVVLTEAVSLKAVASCCGVPIDEIRNLNTELMRLSTPPDQSYVLKIPSGIRPTFEDNFAELSPEQKMPWILHDVKRGETLAMVAAAYNVSTSEIASANELGSRKIKLRPGQVLRVPIEAVRSVRTPEIASDNLADNSTKREPKIVAEGELAVDSTLSATTESTDVVPASRSRSIVHTVTQQGETLYSIANRYGVRLTDLRNWNNLPFDNNSVTMGQKVVLYVKNAPPSMTTSLASKSEPEVEIQAVTTEVSHKTEKQPQPSSKIVIHKVARGETLAQIADDYRTTISAISKENGLKARRPLLAGQKLKIEVSTGGIENSNVAGVQGNDDDASSISGKFKTYRVRRGDILGTIAGEFGLRESQLKKWNPSIADGNLMAGQSLKIYVPLSSKGSAESVPRTVNKVPKYYSVKSGDTIYGIARKYGIRVDKLLALNKKGDLLRIGEKVRLQ